MQCWVKQVFSRKAELLKVGDINLDKLMREKVSFWPVSTTCNCLICPGLWLVSNIKSPNISVSLILVCQKSRRIGPGHAPTPSHDSRWMALNGFMWQRKGQNMPVLSMHGFCKVFYIYDKIGA